MILVAMAQMRGLVAMTVASPWWQSLIARSLKSVSVKEKVWRMGWLGKCERPRLSESRSPRCGSIVQDHALRVC